MIPFLNRVSELRRLRRAFELGERLVVLYGRRRFGKSRLLAEATLGTAAVMFVADRRDARLQREAFAREVSSLAPGFGDVVYPDWDILFAQLYRALPAGTVVAIDEFPYLVDMSPELPSILQKHLDRRVAGPTVALCGSSQALMHGLVLDSTAPLFGRATEILRVGPMAAPWLGRALGLVDPVAVVERWAVWGGVPRYWELALGLDFWDAVADRILDPTGPLHDKPDRLLRDDLTDPTRASSILSLVGRGCHRLSEIAGRLGVPATDLARPVGKLASLRDGAPAAR